MNTRIDILTWFDGEVKRAERRNNQRLLRQKEGILEYIETVKTVLRKNKKFTNGYYRNELIFIEQRIVPYVERWKWLPDSYGDMLMDFVSFIDEEGTEKRCLYE